MKVNRGRALTSGRGLDAFNAFLAELDPRGDSERSSAVCLALACSRDRRFQEFLRRLDQPRYQRYSLAAIAKSCDLSLGEFLQFWNDAQVERAIAIARSAGPGIVSDMTQDALSSYKSCERCDGLGWVEVPAWAPAEMVPGYLGPLSDHPEAPAVRTCPACGGSRKIRKPGDRHAREKVLEIAGPIGMPASVQVVAFNFNPVVERTDRITVDADPEEEDQSAVRQLGIVKD
jgi:hypothetical protein